MITAFHIMPEFSKNEKSLKSFIVIFVNSSLKGFSRQNMRKSEISVLTASCRYSQAAALKILLRSLGLLFGNLFEKQGESKRSIECCWIEPGGGVALVLKNVLKGGSAPWSKPLHLTEAYPFIYLPQKMVPLLQKKTASLFG